MKNWSSCGNAIALGCTEAAHAWAVVDDVEFGADVVAGAAVTVCGERLP